MRISHTMLLDSIGIYISAIDLRPKEIDSIVLRMKESLSKAYKDSRNGPSMDRTVAQYKNSLRQSVLDLHSLGYPLLSFYIDHHLSDILSNQHHILLVNSIYKLFYTSGRFALSCSQGTTQKRKGSLCGYVHLYKLQSIHSAKFTKLTYRMQVPHMFYIELRMLEIILLGGLNLYECERYQYLKLLHYLAVPFSVNGFNLTPGFIICGTRQPFTTVIPNNAALVEGIVNVNAYASFKLRYSAMDLQVSTEPLKGHY